MAEVSLNSTFGAFLISVIVSSCLFGVTCTQTWYYFTRYSDNIAVKVLVSAVWILEVFHMAFISHAIYHYVILHYGEPASLAEITVVWSVCLNIGLTICDLTLSVFFKLSLDENDLSKHNVPLVAVVVVLSICRLGVGLSITGYRLGSMVLLRHDLRLIVTVFSMHLKYFVSFARPSMKILLRGGLALHVVTDLLVAVSLCYYLHNSRTGVKRTNTMINKLMIYAIHTGLITAVADIFVLAFNRAYPDNLVYIALYLIVGNLYSNSFLASLNARRPTKSIHESISTGVNMLSLPTSDAHDKSFEDATRINTDNSRHIDINISSTVETTGHRDEDVSTDSGSTVASL
ncbi:hypothetical protein ARMGADRAFT_1083334 [Armillaria gallica]|uniref:DUF6534 domain-containing protein n=1 Tax=Armillaria gallica TaxID=47427 RepID=A0A2H3D3M9_ARMGA|nr:hypothetical protein ARMGADRAFT_1083334 [Armillaria gallica]